ncbi:hypothetical protein [Micromonospora sp. NPDC049900]|uniref:hypothetical protein n=1 Tax=unclassified Micromonospora TaxID=2617518 RepID=UPI0037A75391
MTRDWYAWHDRYTDPASSLSRRVTEVRTRLVAALDGARPGPLRAVAPTRTPRPVPGGVTMFEFTGRPTDEVDR